MFDQTAALLAAANCPIIFPPPSRPFSTMDIWPA